MKKGRHRRFEEARKLKQQGPAAFFPSEPNGREGEAEVDELDDEFSDIAAKYGAFDEDDEADEEY